MTWLVLGVALLLVLLLSIYCVFTLFALHSAAPFVPTPREVVKEMLDLAALRPDEVLIDLGSGDGRIVGAAAARGAVAIGLEINPILCWWSRLRLGDRYRGRVKIKCTDLWQTDLAAADVLVIYGMPAMMTRLHEKIRRELLPGARVISHAFIFPDWSPVKRSGKIYLYKVQDPRSKILFRI